MNKLDQIKLEIYERCNKGEISEGDRDVLLEKAEEKYNNFLLDSEEELLLESVLDGYISFDEIEDMITEKEGGSKSESSNKIYINAFKKTVGEYRREINDIKKIINNGNKGEVISRIKKSEKSLMDLKKMVNETPSTLQDNMISMLIPLLTSLGAITIFSSFKKSKIFDNYNERNQKIRDKNKITKDSLELDKMDRKQVYRKFEEKDKKIYDLLDEKFSIPYKEGNKEAHDKYDKTIEDLLKDSDEYFNKWEKINILISKKEKELKENMEAIKSNMKNEEKEIDNETKKAVAGGVAVTGSTIVMAKKINLFKSFANLCINHELKHLKKLESIVNKIYK